MRNRITLLSLAALLMFFAACGRQTSQNGGESNRQYSERNCFVNDILLPTTPVKNQGRSNLCWLYAMLGTIETDRLVQGDSVNLSTDYLARRFIEEQATECYFARSDRQVSLRGMSTTALHLLEHYGAEPFDSYHNYEGVNYNVLSRKASSLARSCTSLRMLSNRLTAILDQKIGFMPLHVFMLGAEYTPIEFAHSICLPGDYDALTSFTHHPFGSRFVLESPDNYYRDNFLNVPIDKLMGTIVSSLRAGRAVCWEGDISEPGFNFSNGTALTAEDRHNARLSKKASIKPKHPTNIQPQHPTVTQADRQHDYERHLTTDDHVMEICGMAHDRYGRRYFIAKNSWGKGNRFAGFMYLSENYVRSKTIAITTMRN
ncbi:MAG: cysteine protease [Prevotella sp.]|jgi:hypothetical protein